MLRSFSSCGHAVLQPQRLSDSGIPSAGCSKVQPLVTRRSSHHQQPVVLFSCAPRRGSTDQLRSCGSVGASLYPAPASTPTAAAQLARASSLVVRAVGRTTPVVAAGWGAPVEFRSATVVSSAPVAEGLTLITLDVGELAKGYAAAGQYMQVKVGDSKPGFFAIASPPASSSSSTGNGSPQSTTSSSNSDTTTTAVATDSSSSNTSSASSVSANASAPTGHLEFLIKGGEKGSGSTAELLTTTAAGGQVSVSPAQGKGFPVDKVPADGFPTILLFATGSGISPVKALIESGALAGRPNVRLYYGTRNAGTTAYADRIQQWKAQGVTTVQVYSDEGQGYVQDALVKDIDWLSKQQSGGVAAFLCGQKEMCNAVKEVLIANGVEADKILLNF